MNETVNYNVPKYIPDKRHDKLFAVILNNEYMKTPTNVYLINLAVADIATLVLGKHQNIMFPDSLLF